MDEERVEVLKKCLQDRYLLFWFDTDDKLRQISKIGKHPEEPGPVAYMKHEQGKYIALDNICEEEIKVLREVQW